MPFTKTAARKALEAKEILRALGLPVDDQTPVIAERWALGLLAVANVRPNTKWAEATCWTGAGSWSLHSRGIIKFWNDHYGQDISMGSYDDVRRRSLIFLVEAGVAIRAAGKSDAATNDPTRRYALSQDAHRAVAAFGTPRFPKEAAKFLAAHGNLADKLAKTRAISRIEAVLPGGGKLQLSPGKHNELQAAIIETFLPTFAPGFRLLYLGDTTEKLLVLDEAELRRIKFFALAHDKLPDIVALDDRRGWLFLVEAVTSAGPISPLRHVQLEELASECTVPRVYVTAFLTRADFRKWATDISWETEAWIAESPGHLIHFDGEKFLGPY